MKRQAKAWLDSARDDLGVVEEIINRDDLTHMVAFHCQQAVEKSFKGAKHGVTTPCSTLR